MKSDYKILIFCLVVACFIIGLFVYVDSSVDEDVISRDSVNVEKPEEENVYYSGYAPVSKHLVRFDPNTADSITLLQLGLQPWMVRGIYKYRAMGGVYRDASDFARVPGLTLKQYRELCPFISISTDYRPASELVGEKKDFHKELRNDTMRYPQKMNLSERLAINTADTTALKRVPSIGSYFARRLVDYRERLGGFVSLDQLLEIKNFPEEALTFLTIPDGNIRKININTADFRRLSAHPYIGYKRTKAIVDYRRLKGKIHDLSQLSLLEGFSDAERARLEPYIEY